MRNRKNELDVDFIGDQNRQLTEKEAKAVSDYINAQKAESNLGEAIEKARKEGYTPEETVLATLRKIQGK